MDNERIAKELLKVAEQIVASRVPQELIDAVENASSFMDVGKELKSRDIDYDFSTEFPMPPIYLVKIGGKKYGIVNEDSVDDPDIVVGDIAIGEM